MRSRYKITQEDGLYFVTSTIVEWIPVFTSKVYFDIIIDSLKYCIENKDLKLYAYVILDNHFHLVVSGPDLSLIMQSLKRHTSRKIIKELESSNKKWLLNQLSFYRKRYKTESDYQVWQEGFHPELIMDEGMLTQKIEYTHNNPVKRGLVMAPEHWVYSSARNYILEDHLIIRIAALPV